MSVASLFPGGIGASYNVGIFRETGPAPYGRVTGIDRNLNFGIDPGSQSEANSDGYLANNYVPKPFAAPYDRTAWYQGCLVFVSNNANGIDGENPRRGPNYGEDFPEVTPTSEYPLHVINMICRDVARTLPSLVASASATPPGVGALSVADPLAMTRYPEALLRSEILRISRKCINDTRANILLASTIIGVASTYRFGGIVVLQNTAAPPALGGQVNPALALNQANGDCPPYPVRNVWGNDARQGAHLYILITFVEHTDGTRQVAFVPYATANQHVPDTVRRCYGHYCEEEAHVIYIGVVRDNHGPVRPGHVERAIGLDPSADIEDVNTAFNTLPTIDVYLDIGGHPKQVTV